MTFTALFMGGPYHGRVKPVVGCFWVELPNRDRYRAVRIADGIITYELDIGAFPYQARRLVN